jgi:Leucine-rich repeat (LRR) protein
VSDLSSDHEAAPCLESTNICGNPVWSLIALSAIPAFFKTCKPVVVLAFPSPLDFRQINTDNLTVLDLRRNALTSLAPLNDLPNLQALYASQNELVEVDFHSSSLTFADYSLNFLTRFPSWTDFPKLDTLLVNYNQLSQLTEFPSLNALFVAGNNLTELPFTKDFPRLSILFILDNSIATSASDFRFLYEHPHLKFLNGTIVTPQSHSRAKNILGGILFPEDIAKLLTPTQTVLDLSGKDLRDVNALRSDVLQALVLSDNRLQSIDWPANALPRLLSLKLGNNDIQIFTFLGTLPSLRHLDLSGTHLGDQQLKSLLRMQFHALEVLILANNNIKTCDIFTPSAFPALAILDFSHNFINTILAGALDGLRTLKELKLGYNSLRKADHLAVPSIVSLDLSHNGIGTVDEVAKLTNCTRLERFWFNDNALTQRTSPRIRCLVLLRGLRELDGRPVSESDLAQVRTVIEANGGEALQATPAQAPPGRVARVNTVVLAPPLPSLQPAPPKRGKMAPRHPR